ncbi:LOW QUALITY PROTEIN: modification methylase MthZI [Halarchaeum acidiphilum MH1-52-1]|uniref:Type II methyltransferase n=1 Tax=Halarchaeum acidiphilum MH1-52-1 TaxID=1261545 RepID=U2YV62_9EURY|nr:LOW QUALITY PROTEIN: modification methylase MthZI [Halarchaeum acidiphilum MH1-52-1]
METTHRVVAADARDLAALDDDAVDLVVTSPPYPMVEMWDDLFRESDPAVGDALDAGDGQRAYEAMHGVLDDVWDEVARVLAPGGIACLNVGDATRTIADYRVYRNHARVADAFVDRGFTPLPSVLWRKPRNTAAKFMGSGTLPPNAYVTLEHEHLLVLRNGDEPRDFPPHDPDRYAAAYFWEERNRWFSDVWSDVRGRRQSLPAAHGDRERSAAYPIEIPYRLINMFSVRGDTVLDPFWGTGTTTLAAMAAARASVGYELDAGLVDGFDDRLHGIEEFTADVARDRLERHREFVRDTEASFDYDATHYDTPVKTKRERDIRLYRVRDIEREAKRYRTSHEPIEG